MSILHDFDENDPEAGGRIAGVTSGIVSKNEDPDGLGRVRLTLPWRDETFETGWVRVATPMAGNAMGMFFLPEVGDEVLVGFDRNDIRFPYVLGSLWSRAAKPPHINADGKNAIRVIHTRRGHTLLFDDGDKGKIEIKLADGKSVVLDADGITIDDSANTIKLDSKGGSVSIEAKQELKLKAPKISIAASATLEIKGGQMLKAEATMVKIN